MHTASPARASLARLPHGPFQYAYGSVFASPLAGTCRRSSSCAGRPLRRRPVRRRSARRRRPLRRAPSSPGALTLPAARGRPCAATIAHTATAFSRPSRAYPPRRPPPPGRCRQRRVMRAPPLRRVVTVGSCVYCVVRTAQPVRRGAGERSPLKVCVLELLLYKARLLIPFFLAFHASAHYTLYYTLCHYTLFCITPPRFHQKEV